MTTKEPAAPLLSNGHLSLHGLVEMYTWVGPNVKGALSHGPPPL